ncbi:MAG: energy-coupling factor transporter ATPase [Euryarchaeota archaeon]|nr:energy-coupling factor transporter ATPase [Euryarchaeota archaeon]
MIDIEGLCHRYSNNVLTLDDVKLHINKGEFVAIIGGNGSGKSTLVRHMNALLMPAEGTVYVCGMDTRDLANTWTIRRKVGMVFQDPLTQFVGATLLEDVAFGLENLACSQSEIRQRVDRVLEEMDLTIYCDSSPLELSGGQMQKAAIAGVLAMDPECIVLDEVTSMLDTASRSRVLQVVEHLHQQGITIVHVTHRLDEIFHADRVVVMDDARIVFDGNPADVFEDATLGNMGLDVPPIIELAGRLKRAGLLQGDICPSSIPALGDEICRSM